MEHYCIWTFETLWIRERWYRAPYTCPVHLVSLTRSRGFTRLNDDHARAPTRRASHLEITRHSWGNSHTVLWYEGIIYLGRGTPVTKSHLVPHSTPTFFELCHILFVFWLVESSILCKSHRLNNRTVVICTLLQTNKTLRRLPCLWTTIVLQDIVIVALGVHVVVVLTRTPLVNEESTPRRLLVRRW